MSSDCIKWWPNVEWKISLTSLSQIPQLNRRGGWERNLENGKFFLAKTSSVAMDVLWWQDRTESFISHVFSLLPHQDYSLDLSKYYSESVSKAVCLCKCWDMSLVLKIRHQICNVFNPLLNNLFSQSVRFDKRTASGHFDVK